MSTNRILPFFIVAVSMSILNVPQAGAEDAPNADRIEALREEARTIRKEAELVYEAAVPACYKRFLVNHCLDKAKKTQLEGIRKARAMDIEAGNLELADKQRRAAEQGRTVPDRAADKSIPPYADIESISDGIEERAEQLRREREAALARAEAQAAEARAQRDAEREARRAKAERDAAERAEQARRDRERYDERLRKAEERRQEEN